VRKAAAIRKGASVGSWLYKVAYRVALRLRAVGAARQPTVTFEPAVQPVDDLLWCDLRPVLDEEVSRLPERYRVPFVLCYLEGRTNAQAARELGCPEGTILSRLAWARRRLRQRLVRRGVACSGGALALALAQGTAPAALPIALVGETCSTTGLGMVSDRVRDLTEGVLKTMVCTKLKLAAVLVILAVAGIGAGAATYRAMVEGPAEPGAASTSPQEADDTPPREGQERRLAEEPAKPTEGQVKKQLAGVWLPEVADMGGVSMLARGWQSRLTVTGDSFALSRFMNVSSDLKGTFILDPAAEPKAIDLRIDEFDLSEAGAPVKIPTLTLPGIYQLDGDQLTVCFPIDPTVKRPADFHPRDKRAVVLTLGRADANFKEFPKEVAISVLDPEGKPAAGATVFGFMSRHENHQNKETKPEWQYFDSFKTGADGTATVPYEKLQLAPAAARLPERHLIGYAPVSPLSLQKGKVTVRLQPECRLTGSIVCDELKKAGKPLEWTNVYLMHNGVRIADCDSSQGLFEFPVPPGNFTLHAYGSELRGKHVTVNVPANRDEFCADPIALTASRFLLLQGQPAPELEAVVGWKGEKVKLADLRGKYVLLEFWGYWCGPCVQSMPVLFALHEKFHEQGLAIVGVHLDIEGEVDTPAKLDEKVASFRKEMWQGKDLPFPVALTSGKQIDDGEGDLIRGGPAARYGVLSYPTTILIDREGKVVRRFHARDAKTAIAEVEKLLNPEK
jgi:uncharacterized protein (TIGR03067 family)